MKILEGIHCGSANTTGPVDPRRFRGWPLNRENATPEMSPATSPSIVAILFFVASPSKAPKAMIGARQAKYKNRKDEII